MTKKRRNVSGFICEMLGVRNAAILFPIHNKRRFYAASNVYKTVSLSNGKLFGGCTNDDCPNFFSPILQFSGSSKKHKHFISAIYAYEAAVDSGDLDIANELREKVDELRGDYCAECHAFENRESPIRVQLFVN